LMFKNVFYKGSVLVPNIIRPAGGMTARSVDGPVESIDITGTILDVAGTRLAQCQGRSLVPLLKGQGAPREAAFSELAGLRNGGNYFVMAATERYRYLYDKENNLACELFDLQKDPAELHNLVNDPDHAGIRRDLHQKYLLPFLKK
jgi:arylsulfatase A-like enzyme